MSLTYVPVSPVLSLGKTSSSTRLSDFHSPICHAHPHPFLILPSLRSFLPPPFPLLICGGCGSGGRAGHPLTTGWAVWFPPPHVHGAAQRLSICTQMNLPCMHLQEIPNRDRVIKSWSSFWLCSPQKVYILVQLSADCSNKILPIPAFSFKLVHMFSGIAHSSCSVLAICHLINKNKAPQHVAVPS